MNRSEQINELAASMAKAQKFIQNAAKDSANPQYKSRYADLASCWDACREALSDNGLAVLQPPKAEGGKVTVTTILMHSSGQWISEELSITAKKMITGGEWAEIDDPQTVGKTITYARRYALCGMCGVAPEDDDGNASSGKMTESRREADHPRGEPVQQPTDIPPELRPIFAGMRRDVKNITGAYELMAKQLSAFNGVDLYDRLCDAMTKKYPKGASVDVHEKCILDLWEGLQEYKRQAVQPEVIA